MRDLGGVECDAAAPLQPSDGRQAAGSIQRGMQQFLHVVQARMSAAGEGHHHGCHSSKKQTRATTCAARDQREGGAHATQNPKSVKSSSWTTTTTMEESTTWTRRSGCTAVGGWPHAVPWSFSTTSLTCPHTTPSWCGKRWIPARCPASNEGVSLLGGMC